MRLTRHGIGRTTLSREAYRALRSAILDRRLAAGSKLVVRVLSEDLALSPTPIKEALAALEREGLVVAVPHRGYFVPRITADDAREIYALREVVEGLAARLAAERAGPRVAAQLDGVLRKQRAAARARQIERYGDLDLTFHRALWDATGSTRLRRVAETFMGQVRLLISTSAKLPGRLQASLTEHADVLAAVAAGNPQAAENAMRHHVRQAGIALVAHLKNAAG